MTVHDLIDTAPVDLTGSSAITALIDADSILYVVGWNNRDHDNFEAVTDITDQYIQDILCRVEARQYAGFFSDKTTYRHGIYPEYKATRKDADPGIEKWKPYLKEHCIDKWGFGLVPKLEADDAVAILQMNMVNTWICSPDKDLKQVPGNHFDYKKNIQCHVSEDEGMFNWAFQMLVGDSGDNIKGIPGCGKVKAQKLVNGFMSKDQLIAAVKAAYGVDTASYDLHDKLVGMGAFGDLASLQKYVHTFDLGKAVPSTYIRDTAVQDAKDIFGDW
jgi:5'-3' exonuclease